MKAIVLVGLPGSGKTTFGIKFANDNNFVFIDEPKSENDLLVNSNIIIASPFYCIKKNRDQIKTILEKNGYEVEFLFFENNKEKAIINCNKRKDKIINMNYWSKVYEPECNVFLKIKTN